MRFSDWPKPAPSWGSHSGTISAVGSQSPIIRRPPAWLAFSGAAASQRSRQQGERVATHDANVAADHYRLDIGVMFLRPGLSVISAGMVGYSEQADIELHRATFKGLMGLLRALDMPAEGFQLGLDVGGGFGSAAPFLQTICQRVYVADIVDYNGYEEGRLVRLLIERYQRNQLPFDATRVEFHHVDAQQLVYRDALFDLVYSINAMEHIPNPELAWREIVRVTRPGGVVALQFDPIWTSPSGHHLWHLNLDPWEHLLLSEDEMAEKIHSHGGTDRDVAVFASEMNRKPFSVHRELMERMGRTHFSRFHFDCWDRDPGLEPATAHPNFRRAIALGHAPEDLIVRGFNFAGIRAEPNDPTV
jgi:ubiquinone/menaquinone biosynthesis C-methylase UbiE